MNSDPTTDNFEEVPAAENPAAEGAESTASDPAAEVEKFRDLALRSRAELDNYRKRVAREKEDSLRYANAGLLERLLPILDNFDLGLDAARNAKDGGVIVMGFDMVRKQLEDFLRESGVESLNAEGQPFDPNLHDAMAGEHSADVPEGIVLRQLRRGYKLRDRLLRPASVVVSKGPAQE